MTRTADGVIPWIDLDASRSEPLHRQLCEAIRTAILDGRIGPGARLPSTRNLASDLDVSRTTVVVAFRQLQVEGYVQARVGAGTYVTPSLPEESLRAPDATATAGAVTEAVRVRRAATGGAGLSARGGTLAAVGTGGAEADDVRPFLPGVPALDAFPLEAWRKMSSRGLRGLGAGRIGYAEPAGHMPLREAVARYLRASRGVRCSAEQVVITAGAQQGLAHLARILLDPGDPAWIEDPAYPGARRALAAAGARIVPVPLDEAGLDVGAGLAREPDARLAYVTPSHQFPTGTIMPLRRRLELLEWADGADGWILEDDYDGEYRFEGRPIQALQGLDRSGRVIYVGTFSKILFPALRLGYVVLPPRLVDPYVAARMTDAGPPPLLDQVAAAHFITQGHFARHIRRMRALYAERRAALVDVLSSKCGDRVEIVSGDAGMHLTLRIPADIDDARAARAASARDVVALPLSYFADEAAPPPGLVLGFAAYRPAALRSAAIRLALAIFSDGSS